MFIKNWHNSWRSLAVWFPAIAVASIKFAEEALQAQLVPTEYIPYVLVVAGVLGRSIKQTGFLETRL